MKKFLIVFAVLFAFLATDVFAKSRSSRSGGSTKSWGSSKTKSSYKAPVRKTYKAPAKKSTSTWGAKKATPAKRPVVTKPVTKAAVATSAVAATGAVAASNTSKTEKPKAVSTSKLDAKQTKKQASSSTTKRFTSKKEAETAARRASVSKNTYTSSTRPATRPAYVPQRVSRNGRSYDTDYYRMPNGTYGYGYRDPSTGLIMALIAADMAVDAAYMRNNNYAYGPTPHRNTHTTHVVHSGPRQPSAPMSIMGWIFTFLLTFTIIGGIIWIVRKNS